MINYIWSWQRLTHLQLGLEENDQLHLGWQRMISYIWDWKRLTHLQLGLAEYDQLHMQLKETDSVTFRDGIRSQ